MNRGAVVDLLVMVALFLAIIGLLRYLGWIVT